MADIPPRPVRPGDLELTQSPKLVVMSARLLRAAALTSLPKLLATELTASPCVPERPCPAAAPEEAPWPPPPAALPPP